MCNVDEIIKLALEKDWHKTIHKKDKSFEKKIDSEEVRNKLSLQVGERQTLSIPDFLDSKNKEEKKLYDRLWQNICPHSHMNPHAENDIYKDYFVEEVDDIPLSHIVEFNELLKKNKFGELNIKEKADTTIFYVGEKGSGKTLWQNVWLYRNNEKLENGKIFWIRLDVEKLYNIWKEQKTYSFTTQDYIHGQLLYVICKHYQDREGIVSPLIWEIIEEFSTTSDNEIQSSLTKKETKDAGNQEDEISLYCKARKIATITELLSYFEKEIAQDERLNIGVDSRKIVATKDRDHSFYIDEIIKKQDNRFKVWMAVAKKMYNYILDNNYFILLLIDGIDNINFHTNSADLKDTIFEQLCKYHLKRNDENIITIISLRDYMYTYLKDYAIKNNYLQHRGGRYVDYTIYQQNTKSNLGKEIFVKRVNYIFDQVDGNNCKIAEVLRQLLENHKVDDSKWNFNYRSFLANHISLSKYIAFKSYWRPKAAKFDIETERKKYEEINFLLNGELIVSEEHCPPQTEDFGVNCFNLFDYKFNMPQTENIPVDIFIYIRLLILIKKQKMMLNDIVSINKEIFNVSEESTKHCIDTLIDYGLIHLTFTTRKKSFICAISSKGKNALSKCISDIHFLYYISLDTDMPKSILDKILVSPNDIPTEEKRQYPLFSIISGLTFLNYIFFKYEKKNKSIKKEKLRSFGFDVSDLTLPIDKTTLKKSISDMLNTSNFDKEYFNRWLNSIK